MKLVRKQKELSGAALQQYYLNLAANYRNSDHSEHLRYMALAASIKPENIIHPIVRLAKEVVGYYKDEADSADVAEYVEKYKPTGSNKPPI